MTIAPVVPNPNHPSPFSASVLAMLQDLVDAETERIGHPPTVLDPMAGIGRIHSLQRCTTYAVEIEDSWAACHARTAVGDATSLAEPSNSFDMVCTSPAYGNRMSDHHDAKDKHKPCGGEGCKACSWSGLSIRKTYRHMLGRELSANNAGSLGWSQAYRDLHVAVIGEMHRVVKPGGLVAVNMSDSFSVKRKTETGGHTSLVPAVGWWCYALADEGLFLERVMPVGTPRMRFGANSEVRATHEAVILARKLA